MSRLAAGGAQSSAVGEPHTLVRPKTSARAASRRDHRRRISDDPTRKASAIGASRSTSARRRNARFRNHQAGRHQGASRSVTGEVDLQRLQVAIVDADHVGAERERARISASSCDLDQTSMPSRRASADHRRRLVIVEHRQHHQHRVGAVRAAPRRPGAGRR
jgi:hypothetical protein